MCLKLILQTSGFYTPLIKSLSLPPTQELCSDTTLFEVLNHFPFKSYKIEQKIKGYRLCYCYTRILAEKIPSASCFLIRPSKSRFNFAHNSLNRLKYVHILRMGDEYREFIWNGMLKCKGGMTGGAERRRILGLRHRGLDGKFYIKNQFSSRKLVGLKNSKI